MIIENLSDTDISAWQLSFDGNVTIDNLWNGKLIENTDGSFKVKNAEHNSVISTNNSASFNFGGTRIVENDTTIGESSDDSGMTVEADRCSYSCIPIMFHVYNNDNQNEHWALIIGKVDGNYQIYDPYSGEIGVLEDTMQYYRNDYNGNWSYEYGVIIKSYE